MNNVGQIYFVLLAHTRKDTQRAINMNRIIAILVSLLSTVQGISQSQVPDSVVNKLMNYVYAIDNFGKELPQEKVYLHFDNTSYYQGDPIWFQCYVVSSELNRPTELSKTLYVELLNSGGEIIAKRTLPIRNGRCHGDFSLTQLPFYSGFYEIRAYTKYMLNFGDDILFSRVFPVFDKPQKDGNFQEKNIQRYAVYKHPQKREQTKKSKKVNLKFFPEGGNLIQGVPSRVAFEATDAYGNPIELSGVVVDREKNERVSFSVAHEGRGVFIYTPTGEGDKAEVSLNDKKYRFDLPEPLPQGFVLHVDNLYYADSLAVTVQKNAQTPAEVVGVAVIGQGKLYNYCLLNVQRNETVRFKINKTGLPAGVAWVVLFDGAGKIVADRLVFARKAEQLAISVRSDKESYQPYDPIALDFSVRDSVGGPVRAPLSVSVRDGMEEVESRHSLLTDLLLMSEIKGYVHHPFYYFESDDYEHQAALDQLLMVQGWRRYAWKQWAGIEPSGLDYLPEQGIEVHGQVVSMVRSKPRPNVQVSSFLIKRGKEETTTNASFINTFDTDSLGRFAFVSDVNGKWNLILSVSEKGKKKDHRIILDRVFSPQPTKYQLADMQVNVTDLDEAERDNELPTDTVISEEVDFNKFMDAYEDSLARTGIHDKIHRLDEVVVKAKKRSREKDIYINRSKSIAYYDVASEMDDIKDRGGFVGRDIHELVINMNKNFSRRHILGREWLLYKGRMPLFVINYVPTMATEMDYSKYKLLTLESIKSIYINEDLGIMCKYADPRISPLEIDKMYGCVVFVETYPEEQIPAAAGKGVRKTWLDGYSEVKEFYQPDYSILPKEEDYRRTLYWNPELIPDEDGNATVRFYNNSRCRRLKITAETISADGAIGTFNE